MQHTLSVREAQCQQLVFSARACLLRRKYLHEPYMSPEVPVFAEREGERLATRWSTRVSFGPDSGALSDQMCISYGSKVM